MPNLTDVTAQPEDENVYNNQAYREGDKTAFDIFRDWLYEVEKRSGKALGIDEVMQYSHDRPAQLGSPVEENGDQGKTLRHLLLSAELQRTHPAIAKLVLNAHEYVTNVLQNQPAEVRERDLFNNTLGKEIGKISTSREETERLAMAAIAAGHAQSHSAPEPLFQEGYRGKPAWVLPGSEQAGFNQTAPK